MIDGRAAVVIFGGFENFCPINRNIIKINHSPVRDKFKHVFESH